jgi:hypothetical protein
MRSTSLVAADIPFIALAEEADVVLLESLALKQLTLSTRKVPTL